MRSSNKIFICVIATIVAVIAIALLVPEYPDTADTTYENLTNIRLTKSGDRLLLRTEQHDYEFMLPANHLEDAFRSLALPYYRSTFISGLSLRPTGAVQASVQVTFGGYDARLTETKSILPDKERSLLKSFDFLPSNEDLVSQYDPALYMTWQANLVGRQYPSGSKNIGEDGISIAQMPEQLEVTADDPSRLEHNRRMHAILSPLVSVKHGVQKAVMFPILLVIIFFGGSPFPGG